MKTLAKTIKRSFLPTSVYAKRKAPCVFLDLSSQEKQARVKIKLFDHINPEASENFKQMCAGFISPDGGKTSFAGKRFINSLRDFFVETERIDQTFFGGAYLNESYDVKFDREGLVGLSRHSPPGEEVSGSGFFITLHSMPNLEKYVAVGEVIEGLEFVKECNLRQLPLEIKGSGINGEVNI